MENKQSRITVLIRKYLRDQCVDEERQELNHYLATPEGGSALKAVMSEEAAVLFTSPAVMEPEVSEQILSRLRDSMAVTDRSGKPKMIPFYKKAAWRIAASLTALLIVAGLWWMPKTAIETYATEAGQKRTVILSDGSLVTLNGNSEVSFRANGSQREIHLKGEAYFDIKHDEERPFYVTASTIEIKVLGTAFNVKAYQADDEVATTLIRGKVEVKHVNAETAQNEVIALLPNEQAVFHKGLASLSRVNAELQNEAFWQKGNLIFEDEPIRDILPELEKWFHVKITVDEQSKNCRFSMNVGEETLSEILRLFETTTNVRTVKKENEIRIVGMLCGS